MGVIKKLWKRFVTKRDSEFESPLESFLAGVMVCIIVAMSFILVGFLAEIMK